MADLYTLAFGIDATGAQQGAAEIKRSVGEASKVIIELRTNFDRAQDTLKKTADVAEKTSAGFTGLARQFGLAKGQLREFGSVGASVFAGDILAKALGFTNVMGAIGSATQLAADGIRGLAVAFRDNLFPSIKIAQEGAERHKKVLEEIAELQAEIRGQGEFIGGGFVSTRGLGAKDRLTVKEIAESARQRIQAIDIQEQERYRNASLFAPLATRDPNDPRRRGNAQARIIAEAAAARKAEEDSIGALVDQLRAAATAEEKRLEAEKKITEEVRKRADLIEVMSNRARRGRDAAGAAGFDWQGDPRANYTYQRSGGTVGGPLSAFGSYLVSAGAARLGGIGETADSITGYGRQRDIAARVGPAIVGGFQNAASTIARALSGGSPTNDPFATERGNYNRAQADAAAADSARQLREEQERINKASRDYFNLRVGETIAAGFEEAIFSGQKLSEVLRQLALDLARLVFRNQVSGPLAAGISGFLSPTAQQPFSGGSGPIALPAGGGGTAPVMAGGVGGGFRLSGRQSIENARRAGGFA